jgi:hypothetical protein
MQDRTSLGRRGALLGGAAYLPAPALLSRGTPGAGHGRGARWVESEFQPSTLTRDSRCRRWSGSPARAALPRPGYQRGVETITTHEYEAAPWPAPSPRSPA